VDNGGELSDKEKKIFGSSRDIIRSAQGISAMGTDSGLTETQLGILNKILEAYTQINAEALKTKSFA
jgi:hypothetical protein